MAMWWSSGSAAKAVEDSVEKQSLSALSRSPGGDHGEVLASQPTRRGPPDFVTDDSELAISPKSVRLLEEAELRSGMRARRRR